MKQFIVIIVLSLGTSCLSVDKAMAGEWGLNVYGLSYHPARRDESDKKFNEVNPGLGLNYAFGQHPKSQLFLDGGVYLDSFNHAATYVAFGGKYNLFSQLSLGLGISIFQSSSYNDGIPFLAPVPLLTYRLRSVDFNMVFFPKYKDQNLYTTIGVYATVKLPGLMSL